MIIRALALTSAFVAAAFAPAAAPALAVPAAPTPARAELRQTKHADVDGDGRTDTVRIYDTGTKGDNTVWKVKVTTATGHADSVSVKIPSYQSTKPWYGWAKLDGHRGAELLLEPDTDDFATYVVLTWRDGALHRELAPLSPGDGTKRQQDWVAEAETDRSGFRFYTASGKRYVNAWQARCPGQPSEPGTCTVKTVRSVWRDGDWHKVAVLPTTKVSNKAIYARSPLGALKVHS